MPLDKHNSIKAMATGLISSLFNVTLSRDVPFCQPLLVNGSTKAYLCSPLFSIPFSSTAQVNNLWYARYGFSARLGTVLAGGTSCAILCLEYCLKCLEWLETKFSGILLSNDIPTSVIDSWGACFDNQTFILSVMAGLIIEMFFYVVLNL